MKKKVVEGEEQEEGISEAKEHNDEFKQFDMVMSNDSDAIDHRFRDASINQTGSLPTKRIMKEWKILEENLPDSIFVKAYEGRIDLLRAVIIGAQGTPYQDGLFFFDIKFPPAYPNEPPFVYYHSFGFRLNPNLYHNGRVCLSLLNTWSGQKDEKWNPSTSTILQVLVSIQGLVLNAKPYFNEPRDYSRLNWKLHERRSLAYNEHTILLSYKTMRLVLIRPPKHFEEFVAQHFRERAERILVACKVAYIKNGWVKIDSRKKYGFSLFSPSPMEFVCTKLVMAFMENGSSLKNLQCKPKKGGDVEDGDKKSNKKASTTTQIVKRGGNGYVKKAFGKFIDFISGLFKMKKSTTTAKNKIVKTNSLKE